MASDRATLNVSARDRFGSRASRRLRREGLVPGVVYGKGGDARPFQVPERDLRTLLGEGHTLLDLQLDGSKAIPVVIKEQQQHPLRGEVIHLDCLEVRLDEEIESEVPIELEGTDQAPGVKEGGVLEHVTREVTVKALPTEIPEKITVGVGEMVIGDTISLATVSPPPGAEFMVDDPEEITIATLSPPRVEEEPEVEEEAVLVGEDGEPIEGEEVPEGEEAPAEGEEEGEQPQPERIGEKGGDEGGGGGE
jgi:large subunit ribosomal protein L25